jgi:hypothetical protein
MYEIYKINEDLYQIHSSFSSVRSMEGTLLAILTYATSTLGFKPSELEFALLNMLDEDKDAAQFGINKIFIRAFNRIERRKKSA